MILKSFSTFFLNKVLQRRGASSANAAVPFKANSSRSSYSLRQNFTGYIAICADTLFVRSFSIDDMCPKRRGKIGRA